MKVLRNWLAEFTPLDGIDADELGHLLSDLGLAVEQQVHIGSMLDGIVVAEVLELRAHPRADRIQLVDVDAGDGEALQICCGAFNMSVGDRVPLATLGTTMPDGMTIERRKMRGEWSNGMLCAADEIGFGSDHGGIMLLDRSVEVGQPMADSLCLASDVLYDLEVNPNRPDAMSVAGVARDIAARRRRPFEIPVAEPPLGSEGDASKLVTVAIADADLCGRFQARVLRGVGIGPSSATIAARLRLAGMRPINNVVDASNYVMLELGQPNHPYDLHQVGGGGFNVRRASDGERLVTLDGVERVLTPDDLLICDATDTPIGIAGIMGGASSEISLSTTEVVVEMAWFQPMAIARSSRRLGLRSEASARFEKGCDWNVIDRAMERFAALLAPAGAELVPGASDAWGQTPPRDGFPVRTSRVNQVLGTDLAADDIAGYLEPLGFASTVDGNVTHVTPPTFRLDSSTEIDAIEEVARIHGYGNIATRVPPSVHVGALTDRQQWRRQLRRTMVASGCAEAMPLPFLAPGDLERCGLDGNGIAIVNPLVAEESILRTSLMPGLLKAIQHNDRHREPDAWLWEIGQVQRRPTDPTAVLPDEPEMLAAALAGNDGQGAVEVWTSIAIDHAIDARLVSDTAPGMHPTRTARIEVAGRSIGVVGEIDPAVLAAHDLSQRVGWIEIDLDALWSTGVGDRTYRKISRFPSSDIDLAFEVGDDVPAGDVERTLRRAAGDLLADLALFDVFRGDQVGAGRRSLAFTLRVQATDRTLKDEDIATVRQECIDAVVKAHGVTLRG
ncbi:MAG TPA: phenylalanine--tRNA ligase subunit beta [Acidimicrobiales bacterium]|jgi:phenylalanyl-tRNA synthetase beta chain